MSKALYQHRQIIRGPLLVARPELVLIARGDLDHARHQVLNEVGDKDVLAERGVTVPDLKPQFFRTQQCKKKVRQSARNIEQRDVEHALRHRDPGVRASAKERHGN